MSYQERWRANLIARHHIDLTVVSERAALDEWMATLEAIHADFTRKGDDDKMVADRKFQSALDNGKEYQPEQALGEMLFFDWLRHNGFEAIPTNGQANGVGPDFQAMKNGIKVWFEVVTPQPDGAGVIAADFADTWSRLFPTIEKNDALRTELLFRVTGQITKKRDAFARYRDLKIVSPDDPCVIVVNDALLCPQDGAFGVTHGAESAADSMWPLIVHAVLAGGYRYSKRVAGEENLWHRGEPTDSLPKANGEPIMLNDFQNGTARHISAIMQLTLREEYAVGCHLARLSREKNMPLPIPLRKPDWAINPQAVNPLPTDKLGIIASSAPAAQSR
ncbi:hypothetical protein D7207_30550 [Burkholderia cepacia]|nr:hypothetical protein [Burkholderia cepacia]MBA9978136.1 hypothetical protein [Burkholderia cepacia]MBB0004700.1 hypothetical protein [Burkholderia cepacia]MBB0012610.1 hypothetical protein [Burkholderia cepacia]MBB0049381.1 hypothetical protein [Burkholderia cepacia]